MTAPADRLQFSMTAPTDLSAPQGLVSKLAGNSRHTYLLDHGFSPEQIKPHWWRTHGIEISLPGGSAAEPRLTRADLFEKGAEAEHDDGALLDLLWHVLAWGSGTSRRNNRRRIEACRDNVPLLREAFAHARVGDPKSAYRTLIRPGRAAIPYFGPAFFSKFLYFASEGTVARCLILDARVARGMYRLGWSMAPTYPTNSFSYNWYTDTYVSYCEHLQAWAEEAGPEITADMFERALFEGGVA